MLKKLLIFLLGSSFLLTAAGCQSIPPAQEDTASEKPKEEHPKVNWEVNTSTATIEMDGWEYSLVRDNAKKTVRIPKVQYVGNENAEKLNIVFPSSIDGMPVTDIGQSDKDRDESEEFYDSLFGEVVEEPHGKMNANETTRKITKITLPKKLETIEHGSLAGLPNLKEITLPDTLKQLGRLVFYCDNNLEKVVIPSNLTSFSPDTFEDCHKLSKIEISENDSKLYEQDGFIITKEGKRLIYAVPTKENMDIPQGVKTLGESALQYSRAKTIRLPSSVTHIEKQALSAPDIVSIDVDKNNSTFAKDGHCLYRKKDNGLVVVECANNRLEVSPKVYRIDGDAMSVGVHARVKRVIIGENVKEISGYWMDCFNYPLEYQTNKYEFRGASPPKVIDAPSNYSIVPIFCTIYVPSSSINEYRKWIKTYEADMNTKIKSSD